MARRMPTLTVPVAANVPVNDIPAPEWLGVKSQANVLSALRFDAADPTYGAVRSENEPTGATWDAALAAANGAAIQQAADDARDTGGTLVLKGMYMVDRTIQVQCHVDAGTAAIYVNDDTGAVKPAILVGSQTPGDILWRKRISLPHVVQRAKTGPGWSAADVGVEVSNAYSCEISVPYIRWFSEGLRVSARGTGCVYNTFYLGHLDNNKVGVRLIPLDTGGWVNENLFVAGRWNTVGSEGTNIAGARHILLSASPPGGWGNPNNNLFLKPSVEGDGPEYHVDCFGSYNVFYQARWEASPAKVRFYGTAAWRNTVALGYESQIVQVLQEAGASRNRRESPDDIALHFGTGESGAFITNTGTRLIHGGTYPGLVLQNTSSSGSPALAILPAGVSTANAETAWTIKAQGNGLFLKASGDTEPRWFINPVSGTMYLGSGTSGVDISIERSRANELSLGANDAFRTGRSSTAGRPAASSFQAGAQWYDTTLNRPIWSDGSQWRDATGAAV